MGMTYVNGSVQGPNGVEKPLRFLVDSGAQYSLIPKVIWENLELIPIDEVEAVLVDGSVIKRQLSECIVRVAGKSGHSRVILGEAGDEEALLGVLTLESFGFVLDPFKRELRPARIRM